MSINRGMDKENVVVVQLCPTLCESMVHVYSGILCSHQKEWNLKNKIMSFAAAWMHPEIVILGEVGQTEKEKYMTSLICGI